MNDEGRVLDGKDRQEGGPVDVMGRDERYWMRFLKGMFTDRNTTPSLEFCFHAKLTVGSEAEFISPIDVSLIFCWVIMDVLQPSGVIRGWVIVCLWVCPLDDGVSSCPEKAEVEGVIASPPGEVFGSGIKTDLFHFDVPSIFQLFEDGLEVSFHSSVT
jgi:hypothetical protein